MNKLAFDSFISDCRKECDPMSKMYMSNKTKEEFDLAGIELSDTGYPVVLDDIVLDGEVYVLNKS